MKPDTIWHPSPNCGARPDGVSPDMLILHYTGMETGEAALDRLCDPECEVSAHYLIEEDGRIFQLVEDDKRAWHAGVSCWRGREGLNDCSIGIEIVNPGHEFGYRAFPAAQMDAVTRLSMWLVQQYAIPACNVVGHSDVAPGRKQDPGELFDWRTLAAAGVGVFPEPGELDGAADDPFIACRDLLVAVGYNEAAGVSSLAQMKDYIISFQRHWLQHHLTGQPDETTLAMLQAVAAATSFERYQND